MYEGGGGGASTYHDVGGLRLWNFADVTFTYANSRLFAKIDAPLQLFGKRTCKMYEMIRGIVSLLPSLSCR